MYLPLLIFVFHRFWDVSWNYLFFVKSVLHLYWKQPVLGFFENMFRMKFSSVIQLFQAEVFNMNEFSIQMMELKDLAWLVVFLVLISLINLLYFLIVKSLREKPLGVQTIYDRALQDTFFIGNLYSSWVCLADISTRFLQS